jgi:putative acetyltransferase
MITADVQIAREDPTGADLRHLMARHTADMYSETPPESIYMMDASELAVANVSFFVMREGGAPIGMGAFKRIDDTHAEIKSMHVLAELRGRGLSRRMIAHLMAEARAMGFTRLSLETGVQPMFAPARALYAKAGFEPCGPFGPYTLDPNSYYMTRSLA